jgi:hypothetical protein
VPGPVGAVGLFWGPAGGGWTSFLVWLRRLRFYFNGEPEPMFYTTSAPILFGREGVRLREGRGKIAKCVILLNGTHFAKELGRFACGAGGPWMALRADNGRACWIGHQNRRLKYKKGLWRTGFQTSRGGALGRGGGQTEKQQAIPL